MASGDKTLFFLALVLSFFASLAYRRVDMVSSMLLTTGEHAASMVVLALPVF
jgi:hypothetical protein